MNRDELKELFQNNVVKIKFKKSNGEERVLLGTLFSDLLPEKKIDLLLEVDTPEQKPKKVNENLLSVFDVEEMVWRSFRIDSVIEFSVE